MRATGTERRNIMVEQSGFEDSGELYAYDDILSPSKWTSLHSYLEREKELLKVGAKVQL
jgi:hypothetical protein